ncbi:MAG TPA: FCD domain-containing protein [Candidatus Limnocylindria bacterium]|nr:FCD domain-containing protein [Candidatus Limnocylindria bacterium]
MATTFTPIRQARASGEIVSQIERAIFSGRLSAGDRLQSERELAEEFGVSRITVRDALRILEARGLISVKVGASGGAFVAESSVDRVSESISTMVLLRRMTLSELAEARTVVESATAELAAQRRSDEDLRRLEAAVERGKKVVRDHAPHTEASMDFHVAIAEAARNELLSATVRAYRDLLMQTLHDMTDVRSARTTQKWHEEILEAVRARDADAARTLTQDHMRDFEKRLRRFLQAQEADGKGKGRVVRLAVRQR